MGVSAESINIRRVLLLPILYAKWLFGSRRMWYVLLPILCPTSLLFFSDRTAAERIFRYWGLGLQLMGIMTVAIGLHETRKLFDRPGLIAMLTTWLKRRPTIRPRTHIFGSGGGILGTVTGTAYGRVKASPTASLERRIELLEQDLDGVYSQLGVLRTELQEQTAKLVGERNDRQAADTEINQRIEAAMVGGLHLEVRGVVWLFAGAILATMSYELASLFAP